MAHLVIAYPKISQANYEWIQNYRKQNDQRYFTLIEPHFTIVFAVTNFSPEQFVEEIKKQAAGVKKFDFELKIATVNRDISDNFYHEFLVPNKGYSDVVKLHDRLYSETLANHLRLDVDFIPHIGIGNSNDGAEVKKRVDEINRAGIDIEGLINSLSIIEYSGDAVRAIETIELT